MLCPYKSKGFGLFSSEIDRRGLDGKSLIWQRIERMIDGY
ncbi:hypothetical protein AVDCRST_MAG92-3162 [uncultured Coleofasciculus sp.]|uniref:Uncharacterized protein n=1 Tax=uncultured Coleofasciculus sp. TaxID=1267456 RepID=A0A6J4JFB1_9CYAN|nr:hypothetical protein AVDCRST_MAG92-3162 [uncultured Coleofasciculus sp.]